MNNYSSFTIHSSLFIISYDTVTLFAKNKYYILKMEDVMKILFLGGDKRYKYMIMDLSKDNLVYHIGFDIFGENIFECSIESLDLSEFDIILFPISGLSDNIEIKTEKGILKLSETIFDNLKHETLVFTGLKTNKLIEVIPEEQIVSFLDDEEVESINNELTIEGTIDDIRDRKNNSICILGYGTLGKELYSRFSNAGINTFIIARPKDAIYKDRLKNYYPLNDENVCEVFKMCDIVINTIPYNIIPEKAISCEYVPYILDIASFPYGIEQSLVEKYKSKIQYNLYLGIPSKFAPKEASDILLKKLKKVVKYK